MARTATSGREERARSKTGRMRLPSLRGYYRNELADFRPGEVEFRLELLRQRGERPIVLGPVVESFDWADEDSVLTGNLNLRRPDPERPSSLPIGNGMRVRCRARWARSWYEVWTMRSGPASTNVGEGTVAVPLADDLDGIRRNRRDWAYRKTRRRKRGYRCDEVTRLAARREGVRVGRLARGTFRFDKLVKKDVSLLDIVKLAYEKERKKSGRKFIIRMRNGRLEVVPFERNPILYTLSAQLQEAVTEQEVKAHPVTVIEAKGKVGKAGATKTVRYTAFRRPVLLRYGRVTKEKNYGRVRSLADLRQQALRDLAKEIRPVQTATLTHAGIPFIRRGDGARWLSKEPGWHGRSLKSRDRTFTFVASARHRVGANSEYTSEFAIVQDDPYLEDAERLDKLARKKAREKRKKEAAAA